MAHKAIYAGSFDPFTNGHLNVVMEALSIFDVLHVVIANNPDKKRTFNIQDMMKAINELNDQLPKGKIIIPGICSTLLCDYTDRYGISYSIRGIRNGTDYQYEENMAQVNERFGLKTIYIRAGELGYISSSMVRELNKYGKDISQYIPRTVYKQIAGGMLDGSKDSGIK